MSHFNQVANNWDTAEKIKQYEMYFEIISKVIKTNTFNNIIEIGCGTGLLSSHFINNHNHFLGLDTSNGMLDVFNSKFSNFKNVKSLNINLEETDLTENDFDLVISSMAFHHLKNPEKLLLKLQQNLNKNATIIIIDLDLEDGTFHPDPKAMGVHHFGFSDFEVKKWTKTINGKLIHRSTIQTVVKNNKSYPICLNIITVN